MKIYLLLCKVSWTDACSCRTLYVYIAMSQDLHLSHYPLPPHRSHIEAASTTIKDLPKAWPLAFMTYRMRNVVETSQTRNDRDRVVIVGNLRVTRIHSLREVGHTQNLLFCDDGSSLSGSSTLLPRLF
jgi:hypothetical protein